MMLAPQVSLIRSPPIEARASARGDENITGVQGEACLAQLGVEEDHDHRGNDRGHDCEEDLPRAVGTIAGNLPGIAVDDHLIRLGAVVVRQQPDRHQDVLEGSAGVARVDLQIAIRVAGHLLGTQRRQLRLHLLLRALCRVEQNHLIVLDDVTAEKCCVIRDDLLRGKRLDLTQQIQRQPLRPGHWLIFKEVIDDAGRRLPANPLLGTHDRPPLRVAAGHHDRVVVTGLRRPWAVDLRVERPVRNVEAANGVNERRDGQASWRKPAAAPPAFDVIAHAARVDLERQHALWTNRRLDLLVIDERR
jgi:hypothetical protein